VAFALAAPRQGDVVALTGKGHETTHRVAAGAIRFDERDVVREILVKLELASAGRTDRR